MSKRLTAIASSGAEKARIEWGDYGKALPPMNLAPRREYSPLEDARMREAYRRSKELKDAGESLYND